MQVKPPKKSENTSNLYTNLYICTLFVMSYNIKHTIMEEITSFILIVIIVFGILQIILFFKLWGMTNNVKKIRESFLTGADGLSPAKIEFAIGNIEKAKELLKKEFIIDIFKIYKEIVATDYSQHQHEINVYNKEYKKIEARYRDFICNSDEYIDFTKFNSFDKAKEFFK